MNHKSHSNHHWQTQRKIHTCTNPTPTFEAFSSNQITSPLPENTHIFKNQPQINFTPNTKVIKDSYATAHKPFTPSKITMLKNSPTKSSLFYSFIILWLSCNPNTHIWKHANIIPVLKPSKPLGSPSSYCLTSLLPSV